MRTVIDLLTDPTHGLVTEARQPQIVMASSVQQVLREGGAYFCEAPVATGKSYACLLPALLAAGRRVVVATGKKTLQDQILNKDIPALRRVLGKEVPSMLTLPLKGKSNYTCRWTAEGILEKDPTGAGAYHSFVQTSAYGDRAEYSGPPPRWWGSATAEDCVGKRCPRFNECGYIRLKKDAILAKVIVINHHVLGAEMYYGFGKLVGGPYDVLIIDEAHTLAAGIRSAFTHRIAEDSVQSLTDLINRSGQVCPPLRRLVEPWKDLFEAVPNKHYQEAHARDVPVFDEALAKTALDGLREASLSLEKIASQINGDSASTGPEMPDDGLGEFDEIDQTIDGIEGFEAERAALAEGTSRDLAYINQAQRRVESMLKALQTSQGVVPPDVEIEDPNEQDMRRANILANTAVYATKDERGRFGINCAPVNVGGIAHKYMGQIKSIVVCSATLAVDGRFDHVVSTTGIAPTKTEILPTSFKYDSQGFVFIPRDLPSVARTAPDYADVMQRRVDMAVRLVELSAGGAFILTTANDELDAFAVALKHRFPGRVFAQGHRKNDWDGDPQAALKKFRATPDSVLVGSKSFWEGVDVPGGALRLVIMAKLPFPQFNDPIIKARERIAGPNAFNDVQMVDMLIDLRQGVGRLIRSKDDRGCVAILDSRIWDKRYGQRVLKALPWSMDAITSNMAQCERLLPKFVQYFERRKFA